ncbi:MAG: hypothetical protein P8P74_14275 [Crocinitomicaceae bacterium]|nr:hypothetical protein [Crocinitomicaceae bacterium]
MKLFIPLFVAFFAITPVFAQETPEKTEKHLGFALNSSLIASSGLVFISPTATYYQNKHQFELGAGFGVSRSDIDRAFTTNFNYKYFLNGIAKRINPYAAADLAYYNFSRTQGSDWVEISEVSMFVGFGAQIQFLEKAYFGIGIYGGLLTSQANGFESFEPDGTPGLFKEFEFDGAVKFSLGYRF